MKVESRYFEFDASEIELRAATKDTPAALVGLGIVFDSMSKDLGGFRETIEPTALDGCDMSDVLALFNHDRSLLLGRTTSGTLQLEKTSKGLKYTISMPDTSYARDLMESIRRKDISGSSFSFSIARNSDTWKEDEGGTIVRTISQIKKLYDVSPVTVPAYAETDVAKRSLESWQEARQKEATPQAPPTPEPTKPDLSLLNLKIKLLKINS